jgi:hypothetical protein
VISKNQKLVRHRILENRNSQSGGWLAFAQGCRRRIGRFAGLPALWADARRRPGGGSGVQPLDLGLRQGHADFADRSPDLGIMLEP